MFAAINAFLTRAVSGYFLNKSLRFRGSASAYLNRTPATATNRTTWTWSAWVKRGSLGVLQPMFSAGTAGTDYTLLDFTTSNELQLTQNTASVNTAYITSSALFRDPAAWYHIVAVWNTASGTATITGTTTDRLQLWVNGVQISSFSSTTVPTQNTTSFINNTVVHYEGLYSTAYFDGEMAEINFVDGQALAPTAFGAYSIYNQWLPIRYAGTYGTNGFYLPFNAGTSGYASYFNGTNSYVTVAANAAFTVPSSTSFTIEAFIYITNLSYANGNIICANSSTSSGYAFLYNPTIGLRLYAGGGTVDINQGSVTGWVANTWYHVAAVRNGASAITLYRNGVSVATGSSTSSFGTGAYFVGASPNSPDLAYMNGYISNFRLVNGTAVYTTTFTPPTAPLTAVTNTALLTLQNATFVDNSTNNFTVSNFGSAALGQTYPFAVSQFNDASGNSNNWTNNNVSGAFGSTLDYLTDVPTLTSTTVANYAVLNPLDAATTTGVSSNGNLSWTNSAATHQCIRGSIAIPATGAYYFEAINVTSNNATIGVGFGLGASTASLTVNMGGGQANVFSWYSGGNANSYLISGTTTLATFVGGAFVASDVLQLAVDTTNTKMWLGKNNVWYNSTGGTTGNPTTGANPTFTTSMVGLFPMTEVFTNTVNFNFGQQPFTYTAPSGFLPLNTFNI